MTIAAISGPSLVSWEQSRTTIECPPIIPMCLLWSTISCIWGLLLSMLARDKIQRLQDSERRDSNKKCKCDDESSVDLHSLEWASSHKTSSCVSMKVIGTFCIALNVLIGCVRETQAYVAIFMPIAFSIFGLAFFHVWLFALVLATETIQTFFIALLISLFFSTFFLVGGMWLIVSW